MGQLIIAGLIAQVLKVVVVIAIFKFILKLI